MELKELFAHHVLGTDKPEYYVNWGVGQLLAGSDSTNVALLASMDFQKPVYMRDILEQFEKCLDELSISWPDEKETLRTYSETMAKKIISGQIEPREGLRYLSRLYLASFYQEGLYSIWYSLEDDVINLEAEMSPITNFDFDLESVDDFIKKVAKQYLQLIKITLPEKFMWLTYCYDCQQVHHPTRKLDNDNALLNRLFKKRSTYRVACANCASFNISTMTQYDARQKYLQLILA